MFSRMIASASSRVATCSMSEVLADEFKFLLVEQRGLHDDREFAADERRDLDVHEL